MKDVNLVSVIVPVYNVEAYLHECVDSIIAQSYENIEIILVDDGSTDSSGKICDEYLKLYSRIKVVHKKNGGLSDARNEGVKQSRGRYVCFVDSDDYISPFFIEIMLRVWKENSCDFVMLYFCFPSVTRNEAFGLALAEGMYYGKPAVTFTIHGSGVNYVNLNEQTGIECPNKDSKAYAKALKRLCDDAQLRERYGQNARKRIIENFTAERFRDAIEKLMESLC